MSSVVFLSLFRGALPPFHTLFGFLFLFPKLLFSFPQLVRVLFLLFPHLPSRLLLFLLQFPIECPPLNGLSFVNPKRVGEPSHLAALEYFLVVGTTSTATHPAIFIVQIRSTHVGMGCLGIVASSVIFSVGSVFLRVNIIVVIIVIVNTSITTITGVCINQLTTVRSLSLSRFPLFLLLKLFLVDLIQSLPLNVTAFLNHFIFSPLVFQLATQFKHLHLDLSLSLVSTKTFFALFHRLLSHSASPHSLPPLLILLVILRVPFFRPTDVGRTNIRSIALDMSRRSRTLYRLQANAIVPCVLWEGPK